MDPLFDTIVKLSAQIAEIKGSVSSYADLVKKVDDLENQIIEVKTKLKAEEDKKKSSFEKLKFWLPWLVTVAALLFSDNVLKILGVLP